jgi:hypothetical protein
LWLQNSLTANPEGREAVRQLIAFEQSQRVALRAEWRSVWRKASSKKLRSF